MYRTKANDDSLIHRALNFDYLSNKSSSLSRSSTILQTFQGMRQDAYEPRSKEIYNHHKNFQIFRNICLQFFLWTSHHSHPKKFDVSIYIIYATPAMVSRSLKPWNVLKFVQNHHRTSFMRVCADQHQSTTCGDVTKTRHADTFWCPHLTKHALPFSTTTDRTAHSTHARSIMTSCTMMNSEPTLTLAQ